MTHQQLLLQAQQRDRITLCHISSYGGNVGNKRADHAAALGAPGFVSDHNVSARWSHFSFQVANLVRESDNLEQMQRCV